jgi:peptide/nickel transport system substrate-binding protein
MLAKGLGKAAPSAHGWSFGATLRTRAAATAAMAALVSLVLLGAGAGSRTASASAASPPVGEQLTVSIPYAAGVGMNIYLGAWPVDNMAYDGLTFVTHTGKIVPALATSWKYSGKARRVFTITLRKGVRFSDGSMMTAQVVKKSFMYFRAVKGAWSGLATYDSVKAIGPLTVALHLTQDNPLMPLAISQQYDVGAPICSALLAKPSKLAGETCGAGPYVLDTKKTVPGNLYVMNANPYYWNKAAIHYRRMVWKVIANPASALAAIETGQTDVAFGDGTTAGAALKAGITVKGSPATFYGIHIQDPTGTLSKPLGSQAVRQALNYAIDRNAITKVLYPTPGVGFPLHQPFTPAEELWVPSYANRYPYNPTKAKALLAAAGYPDGFTFTLLTTPLDGDQDVVLAVQKYWEQIGVHTDLVIDPSPAGYATKSSSGDYPAYSIEVGTHPAQIVWASTFSPNAANGANPHHISDPQVNALAAQALKSPAAQGAKLWRKAGKRISDLAWFVPVLMNVYGPMYSRKTVAGVDPTPLVPKVDFRDIYPSGR